MTEDLRQTTDTNVADIERLSINRLPLNVQQDLRSIFTGETLPPLYKEVQNMIIQERYDRMDWLTYGSERETAGEIKGAIKLYSEEMNLQPVDIVQKIITRFSLNENEAEQYVMSTLGLQKM